jgi:hypothetical protein
MNCSEFQQRLEQSVEGHGPTPGEQAALAEHLASCPAQECGRLWAEAALLTGAVRCWRDEVPDIDLSDRVLDGLREAVDVERALQSAPPLEARYALVRQPAPPRPAESPGGWWISLATLAAALLLVLSVLTLRGPGTPELASSGAVPEQDDIAADSLALQDQPPTPILESRGRLAGTYAAMPLSATQFLTDAVVLVIPADLSDPEEEPASTDFWADRLGKHWAPIGRELNRSLEVLIDVLPRSETAS